MASASPTPTTALAPTPTTTLAPTPPLALRVVGAAQSLAHSAYRVPPLALALDAITTNIAAASRFYVGFFPARGLERSARPAQRLVLYEFEGCPFCRRAREALCQLDLDVDVFPCPREDFDGYGKTDGSRYRGHVKSTYGKIQFPLLVDPNTNRAVYDSQVIVDYLWATYGAGATPSPAYALARSVFVGSFLQSGIRLLPRHGMLRTPSRLPDQPLELFSVEGSPACMIAREALSSLEIPYTLRNAGWGSPKRRELERRFGHALPAWRTLTGLVLPLLVDPNVRDGTAPRVVVGGKAIADYLFEQYAVGEAKRATLASYSDQGASAGHFTVSSVFGGGGAPAAPRL